MADVLLLHGFKCTSQSYFLPFIRQHCAAAGVTVHAPDLPDPTSPDVDRWTAAVEALPVKTFDLVVAHSLGGCFALSLFSRQRITARSLMLISTSPGPKELPVMQSMLKYPLDLEVVAARMPRIVIVQSLDDPWIFPEYGIVTLRHMKGLAMFYADKGHFETPDLPGDVVAMIDRLIAGQPA
ncbi:MAG: Uncharacterized protein G01um101425_698 [Candidatus Peregrinibacteria bacterium Gr01-1014_25]|nr:MAG: Uncharacterized protein G01um101425_698 [Candidatus Peregrinibacteria bacterium Gr01-1014_25]